MLPNETGPTLNSKVFCRHQWLPLLELALKDFIFARHREISLFRKRNRIQPRVGIGIKFYSVLCCVNKMEEWEKRALWNFRAASWGIYHDEGRAKVEISKLVDRLLRNLVWSTIHNQCIKFSRVLFRRIRSKLAKNESKGDKIEQHSAWVVIWAPIQVPCHINAIYFS